VLACNKASDQANRGSGDAGLPDRVSGVEPGSVDPEGGSSARAHRTP